MQERPGQSVSIDLALRGHTCQGGAARIAQAQELGGLVESFARSVIHGLTQQLVVANTFNAHQLRVATRNKQRDEGELRWVVGQEGRQQMAFQVMNAERRARQRSGQRHGHTGPHQQRTSQTRAARVGHQVDVGLAALRLIKNLLGQGQNAADVVARSQLGHHPAIGRVHVNLAVQGLRQKPGVVPRQKLHQRHAGFVARRFNAQKLHGLRANSRWLMPAS